MQVRREWLITTLVIAAACGAATADQSPSTPPASLPPGVLPSAPAVVLDPLDTTTTIEVDLGEPADIGSIAEGNRVLVIGDSILASTARRYSNDMCEALEPLGWQVEVNAETARFVQFGEEVLDARWSAGWDVVVIGLGSNYDGDRLFYAVQLEELIVAVAPRPVVLLTVSEFTESRVEVNEVIRLMEDRYENVSVVDWASITAESPELLGADGLHLKDAGRAALAESVAVHLGQAPTEPGDCLRSVFEDDSAGAVDGGSTTTVPRTGNTVRPTTTTTKAGGSTTSVASTSTNAPTTSGSATTSPPPTDPPPTDP